MLENRWQTLMAVDADKHAVDTYRVNFPDVDVRQAMVGDLMNEWPAADVILGGPPCQPFSTAGKGEGSDDTRDGWPDAIEAVRRVKPRMFLFENVSGMLNRKHLPYFRKLYEQLTLAGYQVEVEKLDAVNYGAPQKRKRVWLWGIRNDVFASGVSHRWPTVTHAWPWPKSSMFGGELKRAITVGWALRIPHWQADGEWFAGDGSTAAVIGGGTNPRFPGDERIEREITGEPSTTLPAQSGGSNSIPKVHTPKWSGWMDDTNASSYNYRKVKSLGQPATTLTGSGNSLGGKLLTAGYDHGLAVPTDPCCTIKGGGNRDASGHQGGGCPPEIVIDPRFPPNRVDQPGVTQRAGGHGESKPKGPSQLTDGYMVRRLTPEECARLQSCPETMLWPKEITKTAKYRIIGNGWDCNMAAVLSKALAIADPKSKTVLDLFCGGGLCALGWHGRYWTYQSTLSEVTS